MYDYPKVVVTGEVDSGKSTLIGRLLYELGSLSRDMIGEIRRASQRAGGDFEFAYLLDSFEEERDDQLTIDTTQVFCRMRRGKGFVFIDVPGHKELLKNMLSGTSYADTAVLVIDIGRSVEEQTIRHAFILKFLGVERVILVLNKMDTAGFKEDLFRDVKDEAIKSLKKTGIEPAYSIPVSAKTGENLFKVSSRMPWYKDVTLLAALSSPFKKRSGSGRLRFLVQDVYGPDGQKVLLGKIDSGTIKKREEILVLPLNKRSRVRTIKSFNRNKASASAPESTGLIVEEMEGIGRGSVICKGTEGLPRVTTEIPVKFFCISELSATAPLKFRCATQETGARIGPVNTVWDTATLEPKPEKNFFAQTDAVEATIFTECPVVVDDFQGSNSLGRFILKNDGQICAVGVVCQKRED